MGGNPNAQLGVATPAQYSTAAGATFCPVYSERRDQMWAIGDIDMLSISTLGAESTKYYSAGCFFGGMVVNIVLGSSFTSGPLSETAQFLLYRGSWFLAFISAWCFYNARDINSKKHIIWSKIQKNSVVVGSSSL